MTIGVTEEEQLKASRSGRNEETQVRFYISGSKRTELLCILRKQHILHMIKNTVPETGKRTEQNA